MQDLRTIELSSIECCSNEYYSFFSNLIKLDQIELLGEINLNKIIINFDKTINENKEFNNIYLTFYERYNNMTSIYNYHIDKEDFKKYLRSRKLKIKLEEELNINDEEEKICKI